jgi:phenylacetate-CoA ligase
METALATYGIAIEGGPNRISIVQVAAQRSTYTLYSSMSYYGSAGFAKVNLHPAEWNSPDDRVKFLDDANPEIYTGDPFAFHELAKLPLSTRPKALISSATSLLPAEQAALENHFQCPLIDMYALNEAGPVAYSIDGSHEVLPHDLYVEILDETGRPLPPGEVGEIVVTGGVSPTLPLIRYQTGDHAALDFSQPIPRLVNFQGRKPVVFRGQDGRSVNSLEVTVALFKIPLPFFSLHQNEAGELIFRTRCDMTTQENVRLAVVGLFGEPTPLSFVQLSLDEAWKGKWIQYTSDFKVDGGLR